MLDDTKQREAPGGFPRGASALLGLLLRITTRGGGAKQDTVSAPVPDELEEPEPEPEDAQRVAAMTDAPKLRKPSPEELALRAKQVRRTKAERARAEFMKQPATATCTCGGGVTPTLGRAWNRPGTAT